MSQPAPMRPPQGGFLLAALTSVALTFLLALSAGPQSLETLTTDLRHRWIAITAPGERGSLPVSVDRPAIGMNVFLEQEVDPARRRRSLQLLRDAGVSVIRQQLPWEQIEYDSKGVYDDTKFGGSNWDEYDDIVATARELGIDVIFRVDTTPRWALPPGSTDGLSPPVRYEDYWDFLQVVAERYRGKVRAYQVWNEPNLHIEWGRQPPDPAGYARLLRGAYQRIKAADPSATVVAASLSPTLTENNEAQNELLYLQGLYDAGFANSFDVMGVQAYGLRGGPDDPRIDREDVTFSRPARLREVMLRNNDTRPVWATEMGWNVAPDTITERRFGSVTPPLQARYATRAFERVGEQWPWMDVVCVWFFKRADTKELDQDWYWFRLSDPDFRLQPVYYALKDYAAVR